MPEIEKHAKNLLRLRKGEEILFWILQKIMMKNICFSAIVHQCNIAFSFVHVQVCFQSFVFIIIILSYRPG